MNALTRYGGALAASVALGILAASLVFAAANRGNNEYAVSEGQQDPDAVKALALWSAADVQEALGADPNPDRLSEDVGFGDWIEETRTEVALDGERGVAVVSRNFGSAQDSDAVHVLADPTDYLQHVTVVFRNGPASEDSWFCARYRPDGSLAVDGSGKALAGEFPKQAENRCQAMAGGQELASPALLDSEDYGS